MAPGRSRGTRMPRRQSAAAPISVVPHADDRGTGGERPQSKQVELLRRLIQRRSRIVVILAARPWRRSAWPLRAKAAAVPQPRSRAPAAKRCTLRRGPPPIACVICPAQHRRAIAFLHLFEDSLFELARSHDILSKSRMIARLGTNACSERQWIGATAPTEWESLPRPTALRSPGKAKTATEQLTA